MTRADALAARAIAWRRGPDAADAAYEATLDTGERLVLRVGDFPAEPLYALLIDGELAGTYDAWPPAWQRPAQI